MPNLTPATDRRVLRTRNLLFRAMVSLMQEMPYDQITVQLILDRADVGRSTFYAHFEGKEDLMVSNMVQILDGMSLAMAPEGKPGANLLPGAALFRHIQQNFPLFKALTSSRGLEFFFLRGQQYWSERIAEQLRANVKTGQQPSVPLEILSDHVAGSFVNLLRWWIENRMPYPPEQMELFTRQLTEPTVHAVLNENSQ